MRNSKQLPWAERRAAPWATQRPTSWTSPAHTLSEGRPLYSSDREPQ